MDWRVDENTLYRLKLYIVLCTKLLNNTNYKNKEKYYFLRYVVIALYRLLSEYSKNNHEIEIKCNIDEIYCLGNEFLSGYYSIVDDNYILRILRDVCPCIEKNFNIAKDDVIC